MRTRASSVFLGIVLVLLLAWADLPPARAVGTALTSLVLQVPGVLVLQPDPANGTDSFILSAAPDWNFGSNASLLVGRDSTNASVARSLLSFDLSALPLNATIVNATLGLYAYGGGGGRIEVRRATAPWTEGTGDRSWTRVPVTVTETAGARRVLEPVAIPLVFPVGSITDPARDLRVYAGGTEVPSQVYNYILAGSRIIGATVYVGVTTPAYGSRSLTAVYSTNGTSVPAYRLRTWSVGPLWTSGPFGTGASGISIADVSGTGSLDLVFGTSDGYVRVLTPGNVSRWATRLATTASVPFPPQVVDLDRDGRTDVVAVANNRSVARLNSTGGFVWQITMSKNPVAAPTLLDVNGDGVLDVLVGNDGGSMESYDGRNGAPIRSFNGGVGQFTPAIFDFDRDGVGEFYFAGDDRKVHAYETLGTQFWNGNPGGTGVLVGAVGLGDLNRDDTMDVVTGDQANGGQEFALNTTDGSTVWVVNLPAAREGHRTLADLDGDGALEVVVGVTSGPLYALRGADGATRWTYGAGTSQPIAPAVVDLDRDGRPEIVYMDLGSTLRVLNATLDPVYSWTIAPNDPGFVTAQQKHMETPAIADLDGDGTLEIAVPTGTGIQVFGTPGLARDWRTFGYNWNHTHRAGDGASPDGMPFLSVSVGAALVTPAGGASWNYPNGTTPWAAPGGDFTAPDVAADVAPGWCAWNVTAYARDVHAGTYPPIGFFLKEVDEVAGNLHAFYSSDAVDSALRPKLTITYTIPVVDPNPRIVKGVPDQVRAEDSPGWTLNLTTYASDDDTPSTQLRWDVTGVDSAILQVDGLNTPGNHAIHFTPRPDAWASMRVDYWLSDPQGHADHRSAWINITPVNDPPAFDPPPTLVVHYDEAYTFDFAPYIKDVDTPLGRLSLGSGDPAHATVSGFNVSFLYPKSYLGQWAFVTLTTADGEFMVAKALAVKVTDDHPPTLVRPLPDVTLWEGETRAGAFDLDEYFADPERDTLFFTFGYSHLTITIQANRSVDIQAQAEWFGQELVTFRGTDPQGAIAEDSIIVEVLPVDDPPVLGAVPDLVVHYDANYSFNLDPYIADLDTPSAGINVSTSSPFISVSVHLITLNFPQVLNGTSVNVTIWIGDGVYVASRTIRVTVSDDWPPLLSIKLPSLLFPEDTALLGAYNLSAFFTDPDDEPIYYSSGQEEISISIRPWGRVDVSATRDFFGTEQVTFRATDGSGGLAEDSVLITVLPVDDAPFVRPLPILRLNSTTTFFDLTPFLGDVDTNVSELRVFTGSPYAIALGRGLVLNFTEDGTVYVPVAVSDGELATSANLTVVVQLARIVVPGAPYPYWLPLPIAAAGVAVFIVYRRRKLEWAFLVTNAGILVCSVSRRSPTTLDKDLVTGMLTTIMDFAKKSFSGDRERELEGLSLGEKRVAIVRGVRGYLAVVYSGKTPGSLLRVMRSLLTFSETRHPEAFSDIVDVARSSVLSESLERLIKYGWWPFLTFDMDSGRLSRADMKK